MSPSDDASNHLDVPPPPPRSPPPPPSSPPHTNATQQAYPTFHQPSLGSQISSSAVQYTSQQYGLAPDEGYNNDQNTWQGYAESSGHGGYENSGDYGYYAGCFTDSGPITAPAPPAKRQRLGESNSFSPQSWIFLQGKPSQIQPEAIEFHHESLRWCHLIAWERIMRIAWCLQHHTTTPVKALNAMELWIICLQMMTA